MEAFKRLHIVRSAAALFAAHGFKKVSMEEVAQAAGVAKGTVYLACSRKEDLFEQALSLEVDLLHQQAEVWLREPLAPDALLEALSASAFLYMDTRPLLLQLMLGQAAVEVPT